MMSDRSTNLPSDLNADSETNGFNSERISLGLFITPHSNLLNSIIVLFMEYNYLQS